MIAANRRIQAGHESDAHTARPRTRVLIADDRTRVRAALRALFSTVPHIDVAGEARSAAEALRLTSQTAPDAIVVDTRMRHEAGVDLVSRLRQSAPKARIIVLTMDGAHRHAALRAGADAYLLKGCAADELTRCVTIADRHDEPARDGGRRVADSEAAARPSCSAVVAGDPFTFHLHA